MGVSQEIQSDYFLSNSMISKILSDFSSIPAAQDQCLLCAKSGHSQIFILEMFAKIGERNQQLG